MPRSNTVRAPVPAAASSGDVEAILCKRAAVGATYTPSCPQISSAAPVSTSSLRPNFVIVEIPLTFPREISKKYSRKGAASSSAFVSGPLTGWVTAEPSTFHADEPPVP